VNLFNVIMTVSDRFRKYFYNLMCHFDAWANYILRSMFEAYHEAMDCYKSNAGHFTPSIISMYNVKKKFEKLFYDKLLGVVVNTNTAFHSYVERSDWFNRNADYLPWFLKFKLRCAMNKKFRAAFNFFEDQKQDLSEAFDDVVVDLFYYSENECASE